VGRGATVRRLRPVFRVLAALWALAFALIAVAVLAPGAVAVTGSWSDRLADLPGAAQLAGNGRGVTVAVLDTWVDVTHPDFGGRVARGVTCVKGRCVAGADQPDTCDPHGTHVSGIVASTRYGVAPLAKVLPIRVLTDHSGSCAADAADVALGIRYAIAHKVKLINVSLGSTFPLEDPKRVLPAAVTAAKAAGDLVIVAAGNGKATAASTYGDDALTVAALAPDGQIASYSQRGAGVDIAAPGGDPVGGNCDPNLCVVSTWQDNGYASDAGTSMAAPFVSGTAALLLSQDPHRSIATVRKIITTTAHPLAGAGAGKLDILAAVRANAPKGSVTQTGTDAIPSTSATSTVTPSITAAPGAGAAPTSTAVPAPGQAVGDPAKPESWTKKIGPVQLLGILVVGGVGLAFVTVSGQRRRDSAS
jgi:subtilisin family serine protease